MPGFGEAYDTGTDQLDEAAASLPVTHGLDLATAFGDLDPAQTAQHLAGPYATAGGLGFGLLDQLLDPPQPLDSETLNRQYGVPGYLRFNAPASADDAAFQQHMAEERRFRDQVLARAPGDTLVDNPLTRFGAGLVGALVDPTNVTLAAATGGLGEGVLGGLGIGEAADGAMAVSRVGRLAVMAQAAPRVLAAGAIDQVPFVGANYALSNYAGNDYSFGDALRDIAAGAVLHTALHTSLRAAGELGRGLNPEAPVSGSPEAFAQLAALRAPEAGTPASAAPGGPGVDFIGAARSDEVPGRETLRSSTALTPYVPPSVDALAPAARFGAWALAVDRVSRDESVGGPETGIAELIAREQAAPQLARLDEASALSGLDGFRPGAADTAVTTRGTEVPVRYGLAELASLTTSHTDDLQVNPAYPAELQPRDRARAGAMARNLQLEAELNPKLLMSDVGAGAGAPVVSPEGVVESGNGRTIALRRAAAKGAPAYAQYKAELAARGYDATGMRAPVLVRMRTEPLSGSARSALAHEMNADVTERMSAPEQAMADAARMPAGLFDAIEENRGPTTSRAFTRAFIDRVAGDQVGGMTDRDGRLSPEGARRVRAAVLARAYGDPRLVGQIFDGEETATRRLGEALADAAPAWAKLRDLVQSGQVPRALDLTPALSSAMDLVRYAAERGVKLRDVLDELLGQDTLFDGAAISPATEAVLRTFYQDEGFSRLVAKGKITDFLAEYARQAGAFRPGPDLFGAIPDETTARAILRNAADRYARGDAGGPGGGAPEVRAPGKSEPAQPVVVDLRRPGGEGDGRPGGLSPEAERGPGGEGDRDAAAPGRGDGTAGDESFGRGNSNASARVTGRSIVAGDPELKALAEATDRLAAAHGLEPETPDNENPDTVAEALRAAAVCLVGEV